MLSRVRANFFGILVKVTSLLNQLKLRAMSMPCIFATNA